MNKLLRHFHKRVIKCNGGWFWKAIEAVQKVQALQGAQDSEEGMSISDLLTGDDKKKGKNGNKGNISSSDASEKSVDAIPDPVDTYDAQDDTVQPWDEPEKDTFNNAFMSQLMQDKARNFETSGANKTGMMAQFGDKIGDIVRSRINSGLGVLHQKKDPRQELQDFLEKRNSPIAKNTPQEALSQASLTYEAQPSLKSYADIQKAGFDPLTQDIEVDDDTGEYYIVPKGAQ